MGRTARTVLVGFLVVSAACGSGGDEQVIGDGVAGERAVDVINFDSVDVAFAGSASLLPGNEGAVVSGDSNVIDLVAVEVRNRVLVIDLVGSAQPTLPLEVQISFSDLSVVELSGEGTLTIADWRTDSAKLILSGVGDVVADVEASELLVEFPGAGSMTVAGQAGTHRLDKEGLGPYSAADLRTDITELRSRGIGEIEVWAELQLTYDVTGQGAVRFWGEPTTEGQISAQGGLISLGPK